MKIGLFFGSFNPIHIGHLVIADYMAEFTDLDKVWFIISPHNPLKEKTSLLADNQRLHMVSLAIEDNRKLKASSIEFKLTQPSYTINTLNVLKDKYPGHDFVLIMGSDNLYTFHKWRNYKEILENFEIYVYPRKDYNESRFHLHPKIKLVETPLMEISSSFIRKSIKNKKDVRYMMPEVSYKYMRDMHFYEK